MYLYVLIAIKATFSGLKICIVATGDLKVTLTGHLNTLETDDSKTIHSLTSMLCAFLYGPLLYQKPKVHPLKAQYFLRY